MSAERRSAMAKSSDNPTFREHRALKMTRKEVKKEGKRRFKLQKQESRQNATASRQTLREQNISAAVEPFTAVGKGVQGLGEGLGSVGGGAGGLLSSPLVVVALAVGAVVLLRQR